MPWILSILTCVPSTPHDKAQLETSSSLSQTGSPESGTCRSSWASWPVSSSNALWQALYQPSRLSDFRSLRYAGVELVFCLLQHQSGEVTGAHHHALS